MINCLRHLYLPAALLTLAACGGGGGGGDIVVAAQVPVAPLQSSSSLTPTQMIAQSDALAASIATVPILDVPDFPTGTASFSGFFVGDLGIAGTTTTDPVTGTVEFAFDFNDPTSNNTTGSIANLRSDSLAGISGQLNLGLGAIGQSIVPSSNPGAGATIGAIAGNVQGNLSVSDPSFAAQNTGLVNGTFLGLITDTDNDANTPADPLYLLMFVEQPNGIPTDYVFEGRINAEIN